MVYRAIPILIVSVMILNMISSCAQPVIPEPNLTITPSSIPARTPTSLPTRTPLPTTTFTFTPAPTPLWSSKEYSWTHVRLTKQTETTEFYMAATVVRCLAITLQYETNEGKKTLSSKLCGKLYADPNDPDFIRILQDKIFEARKQLEEFDDLPKFNTTQLKESLLQAEDSPSVLSYIDDYYGDVNGVAYLVTKNEQYARQLYECCSKKENFEARTYYVDDKQRYYVLEKFISFSDGGLFGGGSHILNLTMSADSSEEMAKELFYVFEFPDNYWVAMVPVYRTFAGLPLKELYQLPDGKQITSNGKKVYTVPIQLFGKY